MPTYELDPISRIEGHLGAKLTVDASGNVSNVNVHGNLWRGFENFLIGREPNDAITFTQRICGVCPVPHGMTATHAVEAAIGYTDVSGNTANRRNFQTPDRAAQAAWGVPAKAVHIRNLILASEYLMSSLTHFYHLAAPSYIQGPAVPPWTPYFDDSYYHAALLAAGKGIGGASPVTPPPYDASANAILPKDYIDASGNPSWSKDVWSAVIKQYVKALRIRRLALEAGAIFAGRMPMTSSYVAGGCTTNKGEDLTTKCTKFRSLMEEIGTFVVREYVPLVLALGMLYPRYDNEHNKGLNTGMTALDTCGNGIGAGCANFLSWGCFPIVGTAMDADGRTGNWFPRGYVFNAGTYHGAESSGNIASADVTTTASDNVGLREDVKYSRYDESGNGYTNDGKSRPSVVTRTKPLRSKAAAYSWLKAPRFKGQACEVGPLARLVVMNQYVINRTSPVSLIDHSGNTLQTIAHLYVKHDGAGNITGLDPNMVEPDLAVALVRAGLAGLSDESGNAIAWDASANKTQIGNAYYATDTNITGFVTNWIASMKLGLSTMDRIRARALESALLLTWILGLPGKTGTGINWPSTGWIDKLKNKTDYSGNDTFEWKAVPTGGVSFGFGATEAPRGALMHMCTIDHKGKISAYQCIVPTTWNASPRDMSGNKGPMERAICPLDDSGNWPSNSPQKVLTPYSSAGGKLFKLDVSGNRTVPETTEGGVEALRIAQSFDPCIACAVH